LLQVEREEQNRES